MANTHNQPRISVIIPNLNHGQHLEQAICSVLDQGYENAELIVIDGGSQDDSTLILETYDKDLTYWHAQWDSGPAEAINAGMKKATGDIICLLSANNVMMPETLNRAAKLMTADNKPLWLVGHSQRVDANNDVICDQAPCEPDSLADWLLTNSATLPLTGSFFSKELFDDLGGPRTNLRHAYAYEWVARLLAADIRPTLTDQIVIGRCDAQPTQPISLTLEKGQEYIDVAEIFANTLPMTQRYQLWKSNDERRHIYHIANAQSVKNADRMTIWQQLLRRPEWLSSDHYRQMLIQGTPALPPLSNPGENMAA